MITCKIELFNFKQTVVVHAEDRPDKKYRCSLKELPDTICNVVAETGDTNIHLFGLDKFANRMADDILALNTTKYSNSKELTIEVN